MKRLLSIVLCFCLAVGMMPAAAFADENELQQDQQEEMDSSGNVIESPWADFNMMSLADEPNLASEPENADYTVELDAFLNETSQEYVVCEGDEVSEANEDWNDYAEINLEAANIIPNFRVQDDELKARLHSSGGNYNGSYIDLADCAYTITPNSKGSTYTISADVNDQTVYLNLGIGEQGYPNQRQPAQISIVEDEYVDARKDNQAPPEGAVRLTDTEHYKDLEFSTWQFFTRSGDGVYYRNSNNEENSAAFTKANANRYYFFLYKLTNSEKSNQSNFIKVTDCSTIEEGKYLIVAQVEYLKSGTAYMVLKPTDIAYSGADRNAHTARIDCSGESDPFSQGLKTVVSFTALSQGTLDFTLQEKKFHVSVGYSYTTVQNNTTTIPVAINYGNTISVDLPIAKPDDTQIGTDLLTSSSVVAVENNPVSYVRSRSDAWKGFGTCAAYCGKEEDVKNNLYTFTKNTENNSYTVKSINDNIYLRISADSDGYPGTSQETGNIDLIPNPSGNGTYYLKSGDRYLAFRRNNWGIFFTKTDPTLTGKDGNGKILYTSQDCEFLLYKPANGEPYSAELPGYIRVTEAVVEDGDYLIAAAMKDIPPEYNGHVLSHGKDSNRNYILGTHLFVLHPSLSTVSNDHVRMADGTYSSGSCKVTMTAGNMAGTDNLKIGDITIVLTVLGAHEGIKNGTIKSLQDGSGAKDHPITKITMMQGDTYKIGAVTPATNGTWAAADSSVLKIQSDASKTNNEYCTFEAAILDGSPFKRTYMNYVDSESEEVLGSIEVVTIKGNITNIDNVKRYSYYAKEEIHTDVYYAWGENGKNYTSSDLRKMENQEELYLAFNKNENVGINFFAKAETPEYALVCMHAENSSGDYFSISGDWNRPEETKYFQGTGAIGTQKDWYTPESMKSMIAAAMKLGCTGAMGFTASTDTFSGTKMYFASNKLPKLEKKILTRTRREHIDAALTDPHQYRKQYEDGMTVDIGDQVHYMISVDIKPSVTVTRTDAVVPERYDIEYSDVYIEDLLQDAVFTGYSYNEEQTYLFPKSNEPSAQSTEDVPAPELISPNKVKIDTLINNETVKTKGITLKLYVEYIVSETDISNINDGEQLINRAELAYSYTSKYDNGTTYSGADQGSAGFKLKFEDYLRYVNLSLDGTIGVNIYLKSNDIRNDYGIVIAEDKVYKKWLNEDYMVAISIGSEVTYYETLSQGADCCLDGMNFYKRFSVAIAPQDMTTTISVYIVNTAHEEQTAKQTFTIQDYVKAVIDPENREKLITSWQVTPNGQAVSFGYVMNDYEKLVAMLKAMLNYGTAVQVYQNHNVDALANSILTDGANENITLGADEIAELEENAPTCNNDPNGVEFIGIALALDNGTVGVRLYFDPKGIELADPTIEPTEKRDEVVIVSTLFAGSETGSMYSYSQKSLTRMDSTGHYILLKNISAHWMGSPYVVEAKRKTVRGETITSTVTLTPLSYIYLLYNMEVNNEVDNKLKDMGAALYKFNVAAVNYFGTNLMSTSRL